MLLMRLSLALATYNEEENIKDCIESCKGLVDEIVIVDGASTDCTVKIARSLGARVIITDNPSMFHINKQKAIDAATGDWILQLDADERVSPELAEEIKKVIHMNREELREYEQNLPGRDLFLRHEMVTIGKTEAVQESSGSSGREPHWLTEYNAFYIPRLNYFLGKYLRYGGVYPDGVIRLIKKGKAYLPCKDIHELMHVEGAIGWLRSPLFHMDSPTFKRYFERNSRYIDLLANKLKIQNSKFKNTTFKTKVQEIMRGVDWMMVKPISWFLMTAFRHKGILDGWQGIVFSFFSALRFPRAYWRANFNRSGWNG